MQHRIAVIRHAKAEPEAASDAERPLAPRGGRDAREGGSWLAAEGFRPERALISPALRVRQTWAGLVEGAGWDLEPEVDGSLYAASADTLLDLVRTVDDATGDLVVVGHNPTVATFAQLLDDGTGDPVAGARLLGGYPPGAIALFEHDGSWGELAFPSARLVGSHVSGR